MDELRAIKAADVGPCVILIDDARCFTHEGQFIDYPTLRGLKEEIKTLWPNALVKVKIDITRAVIK